MHIEREIKFRMPAAAAWQLWRIAGASAPVVRRNVASVYYDTPDERLRQAGVAVRLRRDGRNWLQTLEAQAATHSGLAHRAEWEMRSPNGELDPAAFPCDEILAATGLDLVKIAPLLRPVFETRFTRSSARVALDSSTSVELSIDRGYVRAGPRHEPISEIEIELKSGDVPAMLRYAELLAQPLGLQLDFGSKAQTGYRLLSAQRVSLPQKWRRPELGELATPHEAFVAMFCASLAQSGSNAREFLRANDPEFLHQMRIGLRRLRSALRAFRKLVPARDADALGAQLRELMPSLGKARDWDVFCENLERIAALAPERAQHMAGLVARARRQRAAARRAALETAGSHEFQAFQFHALRWVHEARWKVAPKDRSASLVAFAARALHRLHAKTLNEAKALDWGDSARRHRVRIRVKRLRYACDFFAQCFPRASASSYLKRLGALQDVLGDLNDGAVARRFLGNLAPRRSEAVEAQALRYVHSALAARERRLIAALEPAWRAFEKHPTFWKPRG